MDDSDHDPEWDAAAGKLLAEWGLADAAIELASRSENLVYRVERGDDLYGLRIHRPGYHSQAELISEQLWINELSDSGISVPTPQPTNDGSGLATVQVAGQSARHASLVRWVDGDLVGNRLSHSTSVRRLALLSEVGRTAAQLHSSASAWTPPSAFHRVSWDADGLIGDNPVWGRFWETRELSPKQRSLLMHVRDDCRTRLDRLPTDNEHFSLIHADMHPYNVLDTASGIHVIDFDDAGFGWQTYDLAVALYNFRLDPAFSDIRSAFLDGYRQVRPLGPSIVDDLDLFFVVRSLIWLGWARDRPELFDATRLADAIEIVCADAAAHQRNA